MRATGADPRLKAVRVGALRYGLFVPRGKGSRAEDWQSHLKQRPLAIASGEPSLRSALEKLGKPSLWCETFPQVSRAVSTGAFVGVLPVIARQELPFAHYQLLFPPPLESATCSLLLAWAPRLAVLRPTTARLRVLLAKLLRAALTQGTPGGQ